MTKQQITSTGTELTQKEWTEKQIDKLIPIFTPMPLIKYPYFVSLGRRNRKRKIHYEETLRDGTKIKWDVASPHYLPGEWELKVWCWILHKISETHKPLPEDSYISYTLGEIAEYWNLPHGGSSRALIAKAIENLQSTSITHRGQKPEQPAQDMSYSLIAGRMGQGSRKDEKILEKNIIYLDPMLIKLFNTGMIKPSSLEQIKSLADSNLIAARLYELLGWKFYFIRANGGETVSFMYSDLAKRIGLKREKYESVAKDQLVKAHKYLKKNNIISGNPVWQKIKDDWKIIYKPADNLIVEIGEWARRKKIKGFAAQIEYSDPEIDYALDEITTYIEKDEKEIFRELVKKVLKTNKNGFDLILRAVSEAKQEETSGKVNNRAAYLTTILKKYAM